MFNELFMRRLCKRSIDSKHDSALSRHSITASTRFRSRSKTLFQFEVIQRLFSFGCLDFRNSTRDRCRLCFFSGNTVSLNFFFGVLHSAGAHWSERNSTDYWLLPGRHSTLSMSYWRRVRVWITANASLLTVNKGIHCEMDCNAIVVVFVVKQLLLCG